MSTAQSTHPNLKLITAAFSAIMSKELVNDCSNLPSVEKISVFDHHKTTYSYGPVGDINNDARSNDKMILFIQPLKGPMIECELLVTSTVEDLKNDIREHQTISTKHQRLMHNGKHLEDGEKLSKYNIEHGSVIYLIACVNQADPMALDPATLDPIHDYDFTNINDGNTKFTRGNEKYVRPCGYKRCALNVTKNYTDLKWLGCKGDPDEWPVSYHGTGEFEKKRLAQNGHPLTTGKQLAFARGVYTTPDVKVAEKYGKRFTYDGANYLVIFQNRVNPKNMLKYSSGDENYWINPSDDDVRPYGICIQKQQNEVSHERTGN